MWRTLCRHVAAVEEGIVPGGGVTYVQVQKVLDEIEAEGDELTGVRIVQRASRLRCG